MIVTWRRVGALDVEELAALALAKDHIRIDGTDDDALLGTYLPAAVGQAESFCRRPLLAGDYVARTAPTRRSPAGVLLPTPPNAGVTVTRVEYRDGSGALVVMPPADYEMLDEDGPALRPVWRGSWPAGVLSDGASIHYTAAYVDPQGPPAEVVVAILMRAAHRYNVRETAIIGATAVETPDSFESLLWPYRDPRLF